MRKTCQALGNCGRNMLFQGLAADAPTPPDYKSPPSLSLHTLIGRGKLVAGRIHQMSAAKGYLATHHPWFNENLDTTCPRYGIKPVSFQHGILACPT